MARVGTGLAAPATPLEALAAMLSAVPSTLPAPREAERPTASGAESFSAHAAALPAAPDPGNRIGLDVGLPGAYDGPPPSLLSVVNPLQHLPVVGMIYRAATGDDIPPAFKIAGSALFGGPIGVLGTVLGCLLEEIMRIGPDTSRPAAPAGFAATGQEAGPQPVTPGTAAPDAYLTLATTQPAFLAGGTAIADAGAASDPGTQQRGAQAYKTAETEWQRMQWLEKGIAA